VKILAALAIGAGGALTTVAFEQLKKRYLYFRKHFRKIYDKGYPNKMSRYEIKKLMLYRIFHEDCIKHTVNLMKEPHIFEKQKLRNQPHLLNFMKFRILHKMLAK